MNMASLQVDSGASRAVSGDGQLSSPPPVDDGEPMETDAGHEEENGPPPRHGSSDTKNVKDEPAGDSTPKRPAYRSWKKKYKKMMVQFDRSSRANEDMFKQEQGLRENIKRIAIENDRLLDVLLEINKMPQIPENKRIQLGASDVVKTMPASKLESLEREIPYTTYAQAVRQQRRDLVDDVDEPLDDEHPHPPSFLSADDIDNYLYEIDQQLDMSPVPTMAPLAQGITDPSLEGSLRLRNPNSELNWLRTYAPKALLHDGSGMVTGSATTGGSHHQSSTTASTSALTAAAAAAAAAAASFGRQQDDEDHHPVSVSARKSSTKSKVTKTSTPPTTVLRNKRSTPSLPRKAAPPATAADSEDNGSDSEGSHLAPSKSGNYNDDTSPGHVEEEEEEEEGDDEGEHDEGKGEEGDGDVDVLPPAKKQKSEIGVRSETPGSTSSATRTATATTDGTQKQSASPLNRDSVEVESSSSKKSSPGGGGGDDETATTTDSRPPVDGDQDMAEKSTRLRDEAGDDHGSSSALSSPSAPSSPSSPTATTRTTATIPSRTSADPLQQQQQQQPPSPSSSTSSTTKTKLKIKSRPSS